MKPPRNEFLLKFFFVADPQEMIRLFQERLEKIEKMREEYAKIEARLGGIANSPHKPVRLKALRCGM
jgi:hypothetical protein